MRFLCTSGLLALCLALGACAGGGGTSALPPGGNGGGPPPPTPTPTATPTPPPPLPATITAALGAVNGLDDTFTPNDGDTSSGGTGQTVDGIPCLNSFAETYHIHVFVGLVHNGVELAIPDGIGMKSPGPDVNGVTEPSSCFYYVHTHDASGIVHVESPSSAPKTSAIYTLGDFFDLWGQPLSAWTTIYSSGQVFRGTGSQLVKSSEYTQFTGTPSSIPLFGHEVIWLESGSPILGPSQLPSIQFTY